MFLSEDVLLIRLMLCSNIEMFFFLLFVVYYLFNITLLLFIMGRARPVGIRDRCVLSSYDESISTSKFDFLLIDDVMVLQWYFHGLKGIDYKYQKITIFI